MAWSDALVRGVRSVLAVVAGYAVIALGTILVLNVWLGGQPLAERPAALAAGSLGSFAAALLGGWTAARVAGRRPLFHAAGSGVVVTVETIWILSTGVGGSPTWLTIAGGVVLVTGLLLGAQLQARRHRLRRQPAAPDRPSEEAPPR